MSYEQLLETELELRLDEQSYRFEISGITASNSYIVINKDFPVFSTIDNVNKSYVVKFSNRKEKEQYLKGTTIDYIDSSNNIQTNNLEIITVSNLLLIIIFYYFLLSMFKTLYKHNYLLGSSKLFYITLLLSIANISIYLLLYSVIIIWKI
ncbi:hypothetical protein R2F61_08560 [Mollicutes bacterium LVI A0078]|nr:hypothetical protein RZE84_08335 [Mollicutes bacterium LVI A0075]WOO90753.1 hypothetical protein R2F61_08560 [Mollicutes bacterium LVI A0078]